MPSQMSLRLPKTSTGMGVGPVLSQIPLQDTSTKHMLPFRGFKETPMVANYLYDLHGKEVHFNHYFNFI